MPYLTHILSIGLLCLTLLASCTDSSLPYKYESVDATGWHSTDTIRINIPAPLPHSNRNTLRISVRTTQDYPCNHLHLSATLNRGSIRLHTADIRVSIYNDSGESTGKGILYNENTSSATLPLPPDGNDTIYTLNVIHKMNRNPICGISDVGVIIE